MWHFNVVHQRLDGPKPKWNKNAVRLSLSASLCISLHLSASLLAFYFFHIFHLQLSKLTQRCRNIPPGHSPGRPRRPRELFQAFGSFKVWFWWELQLVLQCTVGTWQIFGKILAKFWGFNLIQLIQSTSIYFKQLTAMRQSQWTDKTKA